MFLGGEDAINALSAGLCKKIDRPSLDRKEKKEIMQTLLDSGCFVKVDLADKQKGSLSISKKFTEDGFYAWIYEGSQVFLVLASLLAVAAILLVIMIPLWPARLRRIVWYFFPLIGIFLSAVIVIAVIRFFFFWISFVFAKPGIWIFPNLFADCGIIESFIPAWEWDIASVKDKKNKKE